MTRTTIKAQQTTTLLVTVAGGAAAQQCADFGPGKPLAEYSFNAVNNGVSFIASSFFYAGEVLPNFLANPELLLIGGGFNDEGVYAFDTLAVVSAGTPAVR